MNHAAIFGDVSYWALSEHLAEPVNVTDDIGRRFHDAIDDLCLLSFIGVQVGCRITSTIEVDILSFVSILLRPIEPTSKSRAVVGTG